MVAHSQHEKPIRAVAASCQLVVCQPGGVDDTRDGVIIEGATLHIRLPWTLLQFADASP